GCLGRGSRITPQPSPAPACAGSSYTRWPRSTEPFLRSAPQRPAGSSSHAARGRPVQPEYETSRPAAAAATQGLGSISSSDIAASTIHGNDIDGKLNDTKLAPVVGWRSRQGHG